jgi:hypothetical protein
MDFVVTYTMDEVGYYKTVSAKNDTEVKETLTKELATIYPGCKVDVLGIEQVVKEKKKNPKEK